MDLTEEGGAASEGPSFDVQVVRQMLESAFKDPAMQLENKAVHMSAEAMRMFVCEAVHRAGVLAQDEARRAAGGAEETGQAGEHGAAGLPIEIQAEHFVKILPQLLLDFS